MRTKIDGKLIVDNVLDTSGHHLVGEFVQIQSINQGLIEIKYEMIL